MAIHDRSNGWEIMEEKVMSEFTPHNMSLIDVRTYEFGTHMGELKIKLPSTVFSKKIVVYIYEKGRILYPQKEEHL